MDEGSGLAGSKARCLGLIGGLGVGATIYYYQQLAKAHVAHGRVADLVIAHADVNRVLQMAAAGERRRLGQYLAGFIDRLARAGAQVAAVPAVTAHICIAELVQLSPIPLVSLTGEMAREVEARRLKRVAVFGGRTVMETGVFGQLPGVEMVAPTADESDFVHRTYLEIVNAGAGNEEQYRGLRRIAHRLCAQEGAEAVVLAGTELALVFNEGNTDFPHIDAARLHLDAILRVLLLDSA
jgi:aspartate racemase